MTDIVDPRIARLADEAEAVAENWNLFSGATVWTNRSTREIVISTAVEGPLLAAPDGTVVHAFFKLEDIGELLRDILAAQADLVKLNGGDR